MEIGNLLEKELRIMTVKMIQDLRKRMGTKIEKTQEMFLLGLLPRRTKEQTDRDEK